MGPQRHRRSARQQRSEATTFPTSPLGPVHSASHTHTHTHTHTQVRVWTVGSVSTYSCPAWLCSDWLLLSTSCCLWSGTGVAGIQLSLNDLLDDAFGKSVEIFPSFISSVWLTSMTLRPFLPVFLYHFVHSFSPRAC